MPDDTYFALTQAKYEKPVTCRGCALERAGSGWVPPDGPGDILLVGEAPGAQEVTEGRPFVGPAGFYLDRLLRRAGIPRETFRIANVIQCRPPKNVLVGAPYEYPAIRQCRPNLEAAWTECRPRVIVALGNTALHALCGVSGITRYRGWPLPGPMGRWVVPTLHPSHLLPRQGQKEMARLAGLVMLDLRRAVEIAQHGFHRDESARILEDPPVSQAVEFADAFERTGERLAWDLETPGKLIQPDEEEAESSQDPTILRISFSYRPDLAMSVPWQAPYLPVIERLLATTKPQVVWNGWGFDIPLTARYGILPKGPVYDAMWLWHLLQSDLPRGLEKVASIYCPELGPWKHLADSKPAWYNAMDALVTWRVMAGLERDLTRRNLWDVAERHVSQLDRVLYEAGRVRGVCIDREAQGVLAAQLQAEEATLLRRAQEEVPPDLQRVTLLTKPPKQFPSVPVATTGLVKRCPACGQQPVTALHERKRCGVPLEQVAAPVTRYQVAPVFEALEGETLRKAVHLAGFNPLSTQQLMQYARRYRHQIGRAKTGQDSLDKTVLDRLVKKHGRVHPIYQTVVDLRGVRKTLSTYVEGFAPDRLGRIYPTYTQAPSTLRLSCRDPNIQNVTHRSNNRWAEPIRRTIVPPPGHLFVEADWTAIEAVLTGYFMGDPDYIAAARQSIHAWVLCQEKGWPFTAEAVDEIKRAFPEAYERTKRVVHGTNYGMTPMYMHLLYPAAFPTKAAAVAAQAVYFDVCPRLKAWHQELRVLAHRQTYLENPWGYRHYFYDVLTKSRGELTLSTDAKRVIAFLPQSSAAAMMKEALLTLAADPEWEPCLWGNCSVHDSICLTVPTDRLSQAAATLTTVMTRPVPQLQNLTVGVAVKAGQNWAEMSSV